VTTEKGILIEISYPDARSMVTFFSATWQILIELEE
jgi:hypothetical protein